MGKPMNFENVMYEYFKLAAKIVVQHQNASLEFIKNKLDLGINHASMIVYRLENSGVIGPYEKDKGRSVLVSDMESLNKILQQLEPSGAQGTGL